MSKNKREVISGIHDMPSMEEDPEFHSFLYNTEFKRVISMMILAESRASNPEFLNETQAIAKLATIHTLSKLLDLPEVIKSYNEAPEKQSEEEEDFI